VTIVIAVAGKRNAFEVAIVSSRILLRYKQLLIKLTKIIYMHVHTEEPESMDIVNLMFIGPCIISIDE